MTEFEFDLHQVGTAALVVDLFYAPQEAPAALRRWRGLLAEAPRQATLTAWVGDVGAGRCCRRRPEPADGQRRVRVGGRS